MPDLAVGAAAGEPTKGTNTNTTNTATATPPTRSLTFGHVLDSILQKDLGEEHKVLEGDEESQSHGHAPPIEVSALTIDLSSDHARVRRQLGRTQGTSHTASASVVGFEAEPE